MGARDLLSDLADAGISIQIEGDRLVVRPASKITDDMRSALRAARADLLVLLKPQPMRLYRLTPAELDLAHAVPWDDAACARFAARLGRFLRLGFSGADADDLAKRLHLRDVQIDDRHLCVECQHLAGHVSAGWRCRTHRAAGVAADLPHDVVMRIQRCPTFEEWSP